MGENGVTVQIFNPLADAEERQVIFAVLDSFRYVLHFLLENAHLSPNDVLD